MKGRDWFEVINNYNMYGHSDSSIVAEVPYNVKVKALNLVGCGAVQQVYCFTQEGGSWLH